MCTSCESSFTSCFRRQLRDPSHAQPGNKQPTIQTQFFSPSLFVIYRGEANGQSLVQRPLSSPLAKPLHSFSRNLNTFRKRHRHGYEIHRICGFIRDANQIGFDGHCKRRCSIWALLFLISPVNHTALCTLAIRVRFPSSRSGISSGREETEYCYLNSGVLSPRRWERINYKLGSCYTFHLSSTGLTSVRSQLSCYDMATQDRFVSSAHHLPAPHKHRAGYCASS